MSRPALGRYTGRFPASVGRAVANSHTAVRQHGARRQALRARGWGQANACQPFMPPETWHEPKEGEQGYRIIVEPAGEGYRHVVTPDEVRARLAQLPESFIKPLRVVHLSKMTRKKRGMPLYGMQWGSALYLYPMELSLVESYDSPPKPAQMNEARMFGGDWQQADRGQWRLVWTPEALRDFYLNNILIHELGHLLDERNTRTIDRERYAEWFATEYGYRPTQAQRQARRRPVVSRHG